MTTSILIVDDDRTIVRLCERILERAAFRPIPVTDPREAIAVLEHLEVDLLLTDIRMPIMDGFELISRAKQFQPDLPVLVMTGYGSIDNAIQALHRGVDGLILKPFENTAELVQAVHKVLDETRQKRDAARLLALRPLFDITERLLAETSPQALEKLILNAITGMFKVSFAGVSSLDPQSGCLQTAKTVDGDAAVCPPQVHERLVHMALERGTPLAVRASGPGSSPEYQQLVQAAGWESLLIVPVRRDAHYVFCAGRLPSSSPFTEADMEMFVILSRQAAVALENARLYNELKGYVRRVEESQRALIQAEKMAAVGRLIASLAHEINNPLQAVRNCLHLAAREEITDQQRRHYLDLTESETGRLVNTVRTMLDFYRPGTGEPKLSSLRNIVTRVIAMIEPQMNEQHIEVRHNFTGNEVPVMVIPEQIQQVFFNLLINAMDAVDGMLENKVVWLDVVFEPRRVRIIVEDSGPGIDQNMRDRIFEPFTSTKEHGTGLGLSVSYGIMERHQGSLIISSPRYGEGACFEAILPVGVDSEPSKDSNCR